MESSRSFPDRPERKALLLAHESPGILQMQRNFILTNRLMEAGLLLTITGMSG